MSWMNHRENNESLGSKSIFLCLRYFGLSEILYLYTCMPQSNFDHLFILLFIPDIQDYNIYYGDEKRLVL